MISKVLEGIDIHNSTIKNYTDFLSSELVADLPIISRITNNESKKHFPNFVEGVLEAYYIKALHQGFIPKVHKSKVKKLVDSINQAIEAYYCGQPSKALDCQH